MKSTPWDGIWTALVTPFQKGEIDWKSFDRLLDRQIEARVSGVVPCGTTGESPTLSAEEKKALISRTIERVRGTGLKVMAGTGSNNTRSTIELSRFAMEAGADALLVVTPYYNKPTQAGLLRHYQTLASEVSTPIFLYNVPGRTAVSLTADTIQQLVQIPTIVGIKEASGSMDFFTSLLPIAQSCKHPFTLLSGDDPLWKKHQSLGANGIVSVASNVIPKEMVASFISKDSDFLLQFENRYESFFNDLFVESNPAPVKWVLAQLGLCDPELRLPLVELAPDSQLRLRQSCQKAEIL